MTFFIIRNLFTDSYNEYQILDILYILEYIVYSIHLGIFKFPFFHSAKNYNIQHASVVNTKFVSIFEQL